MKPIGCGVPFNVSLDGKVSLTHPSSTSVTDVFISPELQHGSDTSFGRRKARLSLPIRLAHRGPHMKQGRDPGSARVPEATQEQFLWYSDGRALACGSTQISCAWETACRR
ncbi:hypothetical protein BAUCODRAFT_29701 [Baudoinia panamericana UAMH 10762]|uniref:Uncharacterized protein n=1 Tax=Baudoinia panamericana (strain UAMH 10762) TaxID=717646 RepID=M2M2B8_BAUPA|nr:uncharacterized protein BAUCODRAFT_29701 [Baudoinia panamericana UAMH 10762]EMD01253.1 hypothetical protein BAUCODRAFT_29701 [Baudoinia panamericana UAMH 10762]